MHPLIAIIVMALFTYLVRGLPILLIQKPIESIRIRSFLHYIPYTILASMTVPYIFYATTHALAAIVGTIVAVMLAWFKKSLITVSLIAVLFAYLVEVFL